jgi:hypothetical protein
MYLHIFKPLRWLRICIYVGGALAIAFHVAAAIMSMYFMTPRPGETWVSHFLGPLADKSRILLVPLTAVGLGVDIYLLILPIGAILQLQLPPRRKLGVILIFMTGLLFETPSLPHRL